MFLSNLYCVGSEDNLLQCPHTVFVGTSCTHARDVGLYCERKYCGSFTEKLPDWHTARKVACSNSILKCILHAGLGPGHQYADRVFFPHILFSRP